ncbi:glycerophosphodiester phosphodiesterase [Motilibacter aurantiacus]|uniref:glycerophosphodiester phosphodiesterase n=1 Tax=Motilibacter aurantiacus TaxID=2714955 RepID=UPI00140B9CA0|nr:glycerophosphodiester phosphodiesterase family protein [Motilibacter aurantiacus]NHC43693.1 glycerophosphodiester phosphodiesterase [Motilibacter aurantiacus]
MRALAGPRTSLAPQVVAHRGASADVAEHTLAAYEKAIADGADALECDVRLTRDGHLVCVHDRTVDRTSDGRGVVSALELADLSQLDFESWAGQGRWHAEGVDRDERGVLSLDRLLGLVRSAGRPVQLAIETKHPTRWAGRVERTLCELLERHGLARPRPGEASTVRVMSFSTTALRRVGEQAPGLPLVWLTSRHRLGMSAGRAAGVRVPAIGGLLAGLPAGVAGFGPSIGLLRERPELVEATHRRGRAVHVWTVDDPADARLCVELGVDVVITNRPAALRAQLSGLGVG